MGLRIIFIVSAAIVAAPSEDIVQHTPRELIVYEETIDYYEPPEVLAVPTHSCESDNHDDFFETAAIADAAGFPGDELHTAVAVAYAESLGDPDAVGRNRNGTKDSGLWQVNSVHGFTGLHDPLTNAQAAYEIWLQQGWTAWYAHTPRGGEYGSGERFQRWLKESQCTIDFYHEMMVYYKLNDERLRGEDTGIDALPQVR